MDIKLRIENIESFVGLLKEFRKVGLLTDLNTISVDEECFPMDIQLNVDKMMEMVGNPIVKKVFGKKIDSTIRSQIRRIIEA